MHRVQDPDGIARAICSHYQEKWGRGNWQQREILFDFVARYEGVCPSFASADVGLAFRKLGAQKRLYTDGVSMMALRMFASEHSDSFTL